MTQISMKGIKFNIRNKFSLNPEVFKSRHGRNPEELKEIELKKSNPRPRGRPPKFRSPEELKEIELKKSNPRPRGRPPKFRSPEELKEIELKKSNPRPRGRPMKELTESEIKVRQIKQAIKELREKYKKIVEE